MPRSSAPGRTRVSAGLPGRAGVCAARRGPSGSGEGGSPRGPPPEGPGPGLRPTSPSLGFPRPLVTGLPPARLGCPSGEKPRPCPREGGVPCGGGGRTGHTGTGHRGRKDLGLGWACRGPAGGRGRRGGPVSGFGPSAPRQINSALPGALGSGRGLSGTRSRAPNPPLARPPKTPTKQPSDFAQERGALRPGRC